MTALAIGARSGLEIYHVGLVVPDVEQAAADYSDQLGLRFASLRPTVLDVWVDGVRRPADLLVTYSMDGPPYLELIEERSGGVWAADALGLSHIGFWAPDVAAAAEKVAAGGWPLRVRDGDEAGPRRFTYHPAPGGLWVELVAPSFADTLATWIAASG